MRANQPVFQLHSIEGKTPSLYLEQKGFSTFSTAFHSGQLFFFEELFLGSLRFGSLYSLFDSLFSCFLDRFLGSFLSNLFDSLGLSRSLSAENDALLVGHEQLDLGLDVAVNRNLDSMLADDLDGLANVDATTVYIWSYKGLYPIARIDGLTYAGVKAAVGESTINTLLDRTTPSASDLSSLRKAVKNAGGHITTYTFKPLVGITSETKPNGQTVNYDYDASGRLVKVSDPQGVLQKYQYNYKIK